MTIARRGQTSKASFKSKIKKFTAGEGARQQGFHLQTNFKDNILAKSEGKRVDFETLTLNSS